MIKNIMAYAYVPLIILIPHQIFFKLSKYDQVIPRGGLLEDECVKVLFYVKNISRHERVKVLLLLEMDFLMTCNKAVARSNTP